MKATGSANSPRDSSGVHLVLTANGPGELAGWARPLLLELARSRPGWRVTVVLWPCVFASGGEERYARGLPLVSAVLGPRDAIRLLVPGRRPPEGLRDADHVLHLGGESALSLLLARSLSCGASAYVEKPIALLSRFDGVFATQAGGPARLPRGCEAVGNLVCDLPGDPPGGRSPAAPSLPLRIGILPGSRAEHARATLPFFLEAAALTRDGLPCDLSLVLSPFLSRAQLAALLPEGARLEGDALVAASGLRLSVVSAPLHRAAADLLVMLPGTSTAEATAASLPMVVVVPYHRPELVPWPGPLGWVDRLAPSAGAALKRRLLPALAGRRRFFALPNLAAGREVVPEIRGLVSPAEVAAELVALGRDRARRAAMSRELHGLLGPRGAARRLAQRLAELVERPAPIAPSAPLVPEPLPAADERRSPWPHAPSSAVFSRSSRRSL
jgi:lipid-A-disaccharide synthase